MDELFKKVNTIMHEATDAVNGFKEANLDESSAFGQYASLLIPTNIKYFTRVLLCLEKLYRTLIVTSEDELENELVDMLRSYKEIVNFVLIEAEIILRNLQSNQKQFEILEEKLASPLSEQDKIDIEYVLKVLKRNIDSLDKIEEKRIENTKIQERLLNLRAKLEIQQQKAKGIFDHLDANQLNYVGGGGAIAAILGGIGGMIALLVDGLGGIGVITICGCCINPFLAIGAAAFGAGLLGICAIYAITRYIKYSKGKSIEKLESIDKRLAAIQSSSDKFHQLLTKTYSKNQKLKKYTFEELRDCLENECQRKANHDICDKLAKENLELIETFGHILTHSKISFN